MNQFKLTFAEALRGKPAASSSPTKELNTSEETQSSFIPSTGDSSPNASTSSAILADVTSTTGSTTSSSFNSRSAAERELLRESNFANISEDVCKLCDGKLDKARLLSCLHIFCESCLRKLLTANKPPVQIECPLCKQITELESDGIDSLICDFLHTNILDLSKVAQNEVACTSCKSKDPAISHCNDCDSLLCNGCDSAHKQMRCFENHRVLHFDQLKGSFTKEMVTVIHKPLFCNKHDKMHLKHYCFTCEAPICNSCLTNGNCGNHRYDVIVAAEKDLTAEILKLTAVANKKIDECENANMQLKTARSKLHSQHNKAYDQIREVTVKLKRMLDNMCNSTLYQLKRLHAERDVQILRQLQHSTNLLERLNEAKQFSSKVRQFANSIEFLHLKSLISTQMVNLISSPIYCIVNYALGFSTEPNKYEENLRNAIGTLHTELSPIPPNAPPTPAPQYSSILSTLMEQLQLSTIYSLSQQQLIDINYKVQITNGGPYDAITSLEPGKSNDSEIFEAVPDSNNQITHANNLTQPFPNPILLNAAKHNLRATPLQVLSNFGSLGTRRCHFNSPHGFCLGLDDEIVVADTNNHRIVVYDQMGTFKFQFGVAGKDQGELWYPRKIAYMPVKGNYVICDRGSDRSRMQIFSSTGHFQRLIVIKYIDIVAGLTVTAQDEIIGIDSVSPTVFVISAVGKLLRWFDCSNYMCEPSDVAISGDMLFICDFKGHGVVVFRIDGSFLFRIGHENVTCFPNGIDVTTSGLVYICDSHGNRFHVACYTSNGMLKSEYECPHLKISRCCGLKLTSEGYFVTLAKNNHHVLVMNAAESEHSQAICNNSSQ